MNEDGPYGNLELTLKQEQLMRRLALSVAFYHMALTKHELPDGLVSALVRDWHAIQVSALFQSAPREEVDDDSSRSG